MYYGSRRLLIIQRTEIFKLWTFVNTFRKMYIDRKKIENCNSSGIFQLINCQTKLLLRRVFIKILIAALRPPINVIKIKPSQIVRNVFNYERIVLAD